MKYSTKLSNAVHLMILIALNEGKEVTSTKIAKSVDTNPAYIRKLMSELRKSKLLNTSKGKAYPTLTKEPKDISLLEIFYALEGDKKLLHLDSNPNPACEVGINIQYSLQDHYEKIQKTIEEEMGKISLQDIIDDFYLRAGEEVRLEL